MILLQGSVLALFALGLSLMMGVLDILNVSHPAVYAVGGVLGWYLIAKWSLPFVLAGVLVIAACGILAALTYFGIFRYLRLRPGAEEATLIASIGLLLIMQNVMLHLTGGDTETFAEGGWRTSHVSIGSIRATWPQLLLIGLMIASFGLILFSIHRTRFGVKIRAIAGDEAMAAASGIRVDRSVAVFYGIGAACAGVAGLTFGYSSNSVSFMMGSEYLLPALAIIVVGGLGSIWGTLLASLVLAAMQVLTDLYINGDWRDMVPFLVIVGILVARPAGLTSARALSSI